MEQRLRPFSKDSLIQAANVVCKTRGIKKPDRLCARGRASLISFFCMAFPDFPAGFPALSNSKRRHHREAFSQHRPFQPPSDGFVGSSSPSDDASNESWELQFDNLNPFQ
jgi:hypothetical protein